VVAVVRVLTVDDQAVFLEVARALVESTPGFALAGEVTSGADALTAADTLEPDLVLLDVRMPGLDGPETARRLSARSAATIVLVSGQDDLDAVRLRAEGSGAVALVLKERLRPALLAELWATRAADTELRVVR
jgi:CheY-like chemotaxis protein